MSFKKAESKLFISLRFFASELFIHWLCTALRKESLGSRELLYFSVICFQTYSRLHALRLPTAAWPWNQKGFECHFYQTLLSLDLVSAVIRGLLVWERLAAAWPNECLAMAVCAVEGEEKSCEVRQDPLVLTISLPSVSTYKFKLFSCISSLGSDHSFPELIES